jgi:hypothetical protein
MENVLHTRIVHDESRARYIALIEFNSQARWAPTHTETPPLELAPNNAVQSPEPPATPRPHALP